MSKDTDRTIRIVERRLRERDLKKEAHQKGYDEGFGKGISFGIMIGSIGIVLSYALGVFSLSLF